MKLENSIYKIIVHGGELQKRLPYTFLSQNFLFLASLYFGT